MTVKMGEARVLAAVAACWLSAACHGGEAAPAVGVMAAGDVRFELRPDGGFSASRGDRVLIRGARLVLAGDGWKGSASQSSMKAVDGFPRRDGAAHVFRGTLVEPVARVTWTIEQRIEPVEGGVHVAYSATPARDCTIAEACVFLDLPVAEWSGKPLVLWPSEEGVFPEKAPRERHFMSGAIRRVAMGAAGPDRLGLAFDNATLCTVQDGREFGSDCYQIYPRLLPGREVRAGTACRLGFTIIPGDPTPLVTPRLTLECREQPRLDKITADPGPVPQFGRFEIAFAAAGTWSNPYDPDEVAIDAVFRTPDNRELVVPAFFFQDYEREDLSGTEILVPKGPPGWRVRFAPPAPGAYRWFLRMRNAGQTVTSPEAEFVCDADSARHGHLRVSRRNPMYFEFDDGTPFFGIGMNIATLDAGRLASADRWYGRFAEAGGNLVRSWWCASGTDVESAADRRPDTGAGRYRQEDCWRIDYLMSMCERLGIHMMCCIETQQALRRDAWWDRFTYNRANGGPIDAPAQFFTDENARRLFRNRLRYLVARWSYSTSLYAWQFWNEVSACNDFRPGPVAAWHREMAVFLRGIDPAAHIIHTNFGNLDGYREIDGLPEMEAVSCNSYSRRDMAQTGVWATRYMTSHYRKPFLLTEYGVGHHGGWVPEDPSGVIVHNGLWGPLMSGSAATGMPWGWGDWIDRQDMYHYWKPVAAIVAGVPFAHRDWRPLKVERFAFREMGREPYFAGVFVEGWPRNYAFTLCPPERPEVFEIDASGELRDEDSLPATLRAGERCTLEADFPVEGSLAVHVPEISESGAPALRVEIDGKTALNQALPRGDEKPWTYWRAFPVRVPAGRHRMTISNSGSGFLLAAFELQRFRRREGPDLDVAGQYCDDHILLWLRNPEFIWLCMREGRQPATQPEGTLTLDGIADGSYSVTWIETTTGETLATGTADARAGRMALATPAVTRSAAAKLVRKTPVVPGAGEEMSPPREAAARAVEDAHASLWGKFVGPDGVIRDYAGELPTPEDCALGRPNAIGWWSPIENGPMFTGLYLPAACERARRSGNPGDACQARRLAQGLLKCASVSDVPGFIARGMGTDGKCHYPMGSDDQTHPWFYGLHAYATSGIPSAGERARVVDKMREVAGVLESTGWRCPCDGAFKGQFRGGFQGHLFRDAVRYLYLLRAMHEVTREDVWLDRYRKALAERPEGSEKTRIEICATGYAADREAIKRIDESQLWIYVGCQGSLARLIAMETDPSCLAHYRAGLALNAKNALPAVGASREFDNADAKVFGHANWRAAFPVWFPQKTQEDALRLSKTGDRAQQGERKSYEVRYMRNPLAAAAIVALSGSGEGREEILRAIAHYKYDALNMAEFFFGECAYYALPEQPAP